MNSFLTYVGRKKCELMMELEQSQMELNRQLPEDEKKEEERKQKEIISRIHLFQDMIDNLPQKEKELAEKNYQEFKRTTFYDFY